GGVCQATELPGFKGGSYRSPPHEWLLRRFFHFSPRIIWHFPKQASILSLSCPTGAPLSRCGDLPMLRSIHFRTCTSLAMVGLLLSGLASLLYAGPDDERYSELRQKMVEEQVAREGIRNEAVLKAM